MTDNEIIKALACCSNSMSCVENQCPMLNYCGKDIDSLEKYALDLIKRQQAEIERLNETLDDILDYLPACTDCEGKTPLGERTEKCVYDIDQTYCGKKATELFFKMENELKTAKAEAVKEFAERLKKKAHNRMYRQDIVYEVEVDNLVKEMVGEEDA